MTAQIKLEREAHIAKLTISNPPANTWTLESLNQLKELAIELSNERSIYALVLTGEGEKFFSAGADLNNFASGDKSQAADMAFAFGEALKRCLRSMVFPSRQLMVTRWVAVWKWQWRATFASQKNKYKWHFLKHR